jgi:hypothetical protein
LCGFSFVKHCYIWLQLLQIRAKIVAYNFGPRQAALQIITHVTECKSLGQSDNPQYNGIWKARSAQGDNNPTVYKVFLSCYTVVFPVTLKGMKMTAKVKTVNYTPEQTEKAKADYLAGVTVEKIAEALGKTARSVIAKLSKEGVYKAKVYVSKTGEKPIKKDAHADAIGAVLKLSDGEIESLAKANKTALIKIFAALANSKPLESGESPAVTE